VTLSSDLVAADFVINHADGAVFDVTPQNMSFSVTLRVDTSAGVDSASAGDSTDSFTFGHDVWGYSASVLSATFGPKTWTDADIVLLEFGDGIDPSQLFVDAELGSGVPTLASFRAQDDGFAFFGVRVCSGTCDIFQGLQIRDFNGGGLDNNLNDWVSADSYRVGVNQVPEPGVLGLLAVGLMALRGTHGRRRV
jgi:hypothetical protein